MTIKNDEEYSPQMFFITVTFIVLVVILLVALLGSVYTVSAGYRGVLLTFGKPEQVVSEEGINFKIPIAQTVKKMEVRTQKIETTADSASKDLQNVQTTIALNYHVNPNDVTNLYTSVGLGYRERIIEPSIQESVKAVTAKFTAEELITKRQEVKGEIRDFLKQKLLENYLIVDDFNIINFQFSESFDNAIEAKQVAEQEALRAERELQKIKIEAEQKIATAQAEAEAIRLQAEQISKSKDVLQLRAIEKWNGVLPIYNGGGALPFIDISQDKNEVQQN